MGNSLADILKQNVSFSGADIIAQMNFVGPDGKRNTYTLGTIQTISLSTHMDKKPIRCIGNINAIDYLTGPRTIAGSLVFAVFNKHFAHESLNNIKDSPGFNASNSLLADELPPFDITISFANEYGNKARMVLYGIHLINEGMVMSINDVYTENTYQYVAQNIEYIEPENIGTPSTKNNKLNKTNLNKSLNKEDILINDLYNEIDKINFNKNSNDAIKLSVKTENAQDSKLGKAIFYLSPKQLVGQIYITNKNNLEKIINVEKENTILLKPDEYSAIFKNKEKQSNKVYFNISYKTSNKTKKVYQPIITNIESNAIKLKVPKLNAKNYFLSYGYNNNFSTIHFQNEIELTNLKNKNDYNLYCSYDNENSSIMTVNIDNYKLNIFNKIKQLLPQYKNYINNCYNFYITNKCNVFFSIINFINNDKINKNIYNEIIITFIKEFNNYMFLYNVIRNEGYAIRCPIIIDTIKNLINLDIKTKKLYIYTIKNNFAQLIKIVDKKDFIDEKVYYNYRLELPQQELYELVCVDDYNNISSSTYIYITNDIYKIDYSNNNKDYKSNIIINMAKNKEYLSSYKLPKETEDILNIQKCKYPQIKLIKDLNLEYKNNIATINIEDYCFIQNEKYFLCIASKDDILNNIILNKKEINSNKIDLSDLDYLNKIYPLYIWIENNDNIQISNCIPITFNNEKNLAINNALKQEKIKQIKNKLLYKYDSEEINNLVAYLEQNEDIDYYNIYKEIINYYIDNYEKVFSIVSILFENEYIINSSLLKSIIYNINDNSILLNNNKNIVLYIDNELFEYEVYNNKLYNINNKSRYTILFTYDSIYKSGFVFIDNTNNKILTYKVGGVNNV